MDESQVKKAVQEYYAQIALGERSSCCSGSSDCCGPSSDSLIQIEGLLDESGIQSADLGLSCGLPTLFAEIQAGEVVLDLGSGAGVDALRAARLVGDDGYVIGVDMTPEMVRRAQQNALQGGYTNVEFRLGEIEALPVQDASVDVVISNCVINLVPDKRQAFREIYRVLRPGGRFSIADIVTYGEMPEAVRKDLSLWAGCIAGAIDREAYLDIIREIGFVEITLHQEVRSNPPELVGGNAIGEGNKKDGFGIASITVGATKPKK